MKEECLICGAPLEYLETDVQMQCEICRKKELAKTRCVNGHYVCSDCHMQGLDSLVELCLRETACDLIAIVERMMALPSCHMHGPEHHVMVGAALLQARLFSVHSHGDRFCEGAFRHRTAKAGGRVPLRRAEQSVHRKALPLQRGEPLSACRRTEWELAEKLS